MKTTSTFLFLVIFLFFSNLIISQCPPPGNIELTSQAEIDNFLQEYPNCTELENSLLIGHLNGPLSDITDLSPLSNLQSIMWSLFIVNNQLLTNLNGLEGLQSIGSLALWNNDLLVNIDELDMISTLSEITIRDNDALVDFSATENVTTSNYITIENNASLTSLSGLASLESVGQLQIEGNPNLVNLQGLSNLESIIYPGFEGGIFIVNNAGLTSLNGLESLKETSIISLVDNENLISIGALNHPIYVSTQVDIIMNPQLSNCGILVVCEFIANSGNVVIQNNNTGCNSMNEISCLGIGISGYFFYDFNQDKVRDEFEGVIKDQIVNLMPGDIDFLSNLGGKYFVGLEEGDPYTLTWSGDPDWVLTTDDAQYNGTFTAGLMSNENNNFGLFPTFTSHDFNVNVSSGQPRCDTEVAFNFNFQNVGTFLENGTINIVFDDLYEFVSSSIAPTSIDLINHTLSFDFEDLYPFAVQEIAIIFLMPDASAIGEIADVQVSVLREDNGALVNAAETTYSSLMACAYDPNDKLVDPMGIGEEHYTLKDEKLRYTLRFQNTGNLDAINVEIRDTLDPNLDWTSFRVLNSSHQVFTSRTSEGAVSFQFPNIFLPAESVDELGSQGFVTYEISPNSGLDDFTIIENTGHIYFDLNPAIVTNTTFNTLVDLLPTSTNKLDEKSIAIHPNPVLNTIFISTSDGLQIDQAMLYNQLGQLLLSSREHQIEVSHLPSGLYILKVEIEGSQRTAKLIIE